MTFLVGEKVKHTIREREGIFVQAAAEPGYGLVDYGSGPEMVSLKHLALAVAKRTAFQQLLATDPDALLAFAAYFKNGGRIEICSSPQALDRAAERVSSNSSLSLTDALDYIKVVSEKSQAYKYDIVVPAGLPTELAARLSVLLWERGKGSHRARKGEVQINSTGLAEYLMREHGVLPKRVADIKLNQAIWALSTKMAELKTA